MFEKYGIEVDYEPYTFTMVQPFEFQGTKVQSIKYTPDFCIRYKDKVIWIESKGMLLTQDWIRMKLFMHMCVTLDSKEPFYMLKSKTEAEIFCKWLTGQLVGISNDSKEFKMLMNILNWKLKRTNGKSKKKDSNIKI